MRCTVDWIMRLRLRVTFDLASRQQLVSAAVLPHLLAASVAKPTSDAVSLRFSIVLRLSVVADEDRLCRNVKKSPGGRSRLESTMGGNPGPDRTTQCVISRYGGHSGPGPPRVQA